MSADTANGLAYARGAQQRIGSHLSEENGKGTLSGLVELAPGTDGMSKADLRVAVAYLAAQCWGERNATGAARAQDALSVIAALEKQVDWWRERESIRPRGGAA